MTTTGGTDVVPSMPPPQRERRVSGKVWALIIIPLVILGVLFGLFFGADRLAAAYVADRIATKIQGYGFLQRPGVTVEGFPFLTQLIGGHLDGVDIVAP